MCIYLEFFNMRDWKGIGHDQFAVGECPRVEPLLKLRFTRVVDVCS
jgi:hypothetical protein